MVAQGYFPAYGGPVRRDSVDYVLHLGDYIYEYGECGCTFLGHTFDRRRLWSSNWETSTGSRYHQFVRLPYSSRPVPHRFRSCCEFWDVPLDPYMG